MTSTGPVRHPKGPRLADPADDPRSFLQTFLESSVGGKILVGLTGLGLVGFVIAHLIGNLKLFAGPESINRYAYFLKHDLGVLIWIARAGLLAIFVLHLSLAVRLQLRARAARPVAYAHARSVQATAASRTMLMTGVVVGVFVLFHLAHYTFGWGIGVVVTGPDVGAVHTNYLDLTYRLADGTNVHDVYSMTVAGFRDDFIVVAYLLAQVVLFVHLRHGVPSLFQTLGVKNARFAGPIDVLGFAVAAGILAGNVAIVLAVRFGLVLPLDHLG
jgi:succinate dehydrogenase / fumarate reductase cytochrome b subunit